MGKKTGALIREARTNAGLTQEKLAQKLTGVTASDISKAERGEKELTKTALKEIAKATGVTQASLLNAENETVEKPAAKTGAAKTTAKKTTAKTASAKASKDKGDYELTNAEKKLIDLYRAASSDAKTDAVRILKGEKSEVEQLVSSMIGGNLNLESIAKLLKKK